MPEQVDIAQMMVRLGVAEGDIQALNANLNKVSAAFEKTKSGAHESAEAVKESGAEFGAFRSPVLEAIFAVHAFVDEVRETVAVLGEISGVKVATEYLRLANALDNVTHSARQTKEIMEQIEDIKSPYLNSILIAYAPKLANSGIAAGDVPKDLGSITNLAAEGNLTNDQMPALLDELVKLRSEDHPMIRQLSDQFAGLPITDIVNKGAGTHFSNSNQAYDYLQGMRGNQAYEILLKGADALNKSAGAMLLLRDPTMAWAKALETVEDIMKPTGDLLLPILGGAVELLSDLADVLKKVNEATGGAAGLIALTLLVKKNFGLLVDTFYAVIRFTRDLTAAVEKYGEAAESAAIKSEVHGGDVAAAGIANAGSAEKEAGEVAAGAAAGSGIKAWFSKLLGGVKGAFSVGGLVKGLNIGGFLASIGLGMLGDHVGGKAGAGLTGAAKGLGIGDMIAMVTPGLWKLIPLLGGALIGGIMGVKSFDKDKDHTDALNKNTAALEGLRGRIVGGSQRARSAASQLQMEYSVARLLGAGIG